MAMSRYHKDGANYIQRMDWLHQQIVKYEDDLKMTEESLKKATWKNMVELEKGYLRWSVDETVEWISMINQSHFSAPKYECFIENVRRMEINGRQLEELDNKFALELAGLGTFADQQIIRTHVFRIV